MTEKQFLEALAGLKRKWKLDRLGGIRYQTRDYSYCPITAMAKVMGHGYFDMGLYNIAAKELGIKPKLAVKIVLAADNNTKVKAFNAELRKTLLQICKLKEIKKPKIKGGLAWTIPEKKKKGKSKKK